jgi:hypothetical protein
VSNKVPTICLMFVSLMGWWSAYVHLQRESQWHALALEATAIAEECVNSKGRKSVEDPNPQNYMLMLTWGGRIFLVDRSPVDPALVSFPDYRRTQMLRSMCGPKEFVPLILREFRRVTPRAGGDCPIYLEVQ